MKKTARFLQGFSLIELMIVISVIAILSTIALFGFGKIQATGRDTSRAQTMNGIRGALERYNASGQSYPSTSGFGPLIDSLTAGGFLSEDPVDPLSSCTSYNSVPATGNWFPCGSGKVPVYIYDASTTAQDLTRCGTYTGTPPVFTTTGCTAGCSGTAGTCYKLYLIKESGGVQVFQSPN